MFWLGLTGCMASSPAAAAAASSDSKAVELLQWVGLHRIQRWLVCKQRSVWNNCTRGGKELQKKKHFDPTNIHIVHWGNPNKSIGLHIAEGPECLAGNGGYIIYDPEHVAFHRIISKIMPRIILTNHKTNLLQCHAVRHQANHTSEIYPESYLLESYLPCYTLSWHWYFLKYYLAFVVTANVVRCKPCDDYDIWHCKIITNTYQWSRVSSSGENETNKVLVMKSKGYFCLQTLLSL